MVFKISLISSFCFLEPQAQEVEDNLVYLNRQQIKQLCENEFFDEQITRSKDERTTLAKHDTTLEPNTSLCQHHIELHIELQLRCLTRVSLILETDKNSLHFESQASPNKLKHAHNLIGNKLQGKGANSWSQQRITK